MLLNEKKNHYLRAGLVLTGLMAALALLVQAALTAHASTQKQAASVLKLVTLLT